MRRPLTLPAEVLAGRDQPAAEERLPRAVGGDARNQRVLARRQPAREVEAVGFAGYQPKPIRLKEFMVAVEGALGK